MNLFQNENKKEFAAKEKFILRPAQDSLFEPEPIRSESRGQRPQGRSLSLLKDWKLHHFQIRKTERLFFNLRLTLF
jgi:hypothetical protein